MKPRQLKDREEMMCDCIDHKGDNGKYFWKVDIKSAVEWLKIGISHESIKGKVSTKYVMERITEAFEDVMKPKKRNHKKGRL